jgi:DNA-binding LacI/PurR family transcriptional regulator
MLRVTLQSNKVKKAAMVNERSSDVVTIRDVARAANVTGITVSRALNGTAPVAEETRQRIEKAAKELGYVPNRLATALRSGQTKTIGILWSLGGPHIGAQLVNNMVLHALKHGYAAQVCDFMWFSNLKAVLDDFAQRRIDAVIIEWPYDDVTEYAEQLSKFSAVVLVPSIPLKTTFDQIVLDRCQAICDVADHFVATGRQRPVYVSTEIPQGMKVEAFLKRLQKHGFNDTDQYYIPVEHLPEDKTQGDGYIRALSTVWDDSKPYDAILCTTDEGSAALMHWLQDRKFCIPEDVAVVGFNDNEQSRFMNPPLASVDRRNDRLIELIEKMLFSRLKDSKRPTQKERISMKFICRQSAESCK